MARFGDPMGRRKPAESTSYDLDGLRKAFAAFEGFHTAERRITGVAAVAAAARACLLPGQHVGSGALPEPKSEVQRYFRIRTAELAETEALAECLRVIGDAAGDLIHAPVAGSDLVRVVSAMSAVIESFPAGGMPVSAGETPDQACREPAVDEMWMWRWIVGHQLHAMFNVYAAYALGDAADALRAGCDDEAIEALETATRIVGGFAGARAQALAVPGWFYQEVLRPSMLPPLTGAPLSGRMHTEYRGYRKRLGEVLELVPQTSVELASTRPRLAFARERLLEADLVEAERHVTLVEPVVSMSRSLIQTGRSSDNAVSALRRIRHRRAAEIEPYVRFPDGASSTGTVSAK
ncbi:hypothetical protein [Amycolatopsis sp. Hca4]|uniref:hypothetical protein n=1 Tax=Amycolatopsis sp. Hca4 TaxID=2742131 RepID=UPI00159175E2|nr:hypothetical protein [Amycolatopsis sp. Hca4]QKV80633.1 hypothetical protein HUT10_47800 [Amycolatopsis sp. Hca4]